MDADQLKLLAERLRESLSRAGVTLSHGQTLDLVAALPGLRNWPEVIAFPDRLAARECDFEAMSRLAHRISSRLGTRMTERAARQIDAHSLMNMLMPWRLTAPTDRSLRERLIVASGDSACGSLRAAQISDRVEGIADRLVWGPVPPDANDPETFHAERLMAWDADPDTDDQPEPWERKDDTQRPGQPLAWAALLPVIAEYARIELWMDPDVNGQLLLLHLLDWFGRQPQLASRLFIAQIGTQLGEAKPYEHRIRPPRLCAASARQIALATRAWNAFRQPTPQAWWGLLADDLDAIPGLRDTVRKMLAELPEANTGLRASERRLLELVADEGATPRQVMTRMNHSRDPGVFAYWEFGRLLNDLGRGTRPAIAGIEDGPFDLALHDRNAGRLDAYMRSPLQLSAFGQTLLRGEDDLMRHVPRRFWWGGTLITPDRPWRWNAQEEVLSR